MDGVPCGTEWVRRVREIVGAGRPEEISTCHLAVARVHCVMVKSGLVQYKKTYFSTPGRVSSAPFSFWCRAFVTPPLAGELQPQHAHLRVVRPRGRALRLHEGAAWQEGRATVQAVPDHARFAGNRDCAALLRLDRAGRGPRGCPARPRDALRHVHRAAARWRTSLAPVRPVRRAQLLQPRVSADGLEAVRAPPKLRAAVAADGRAAARRQRRAAAAHRALRLQQQQQ